LTVVAYVLLLAAAGIAIYRQSSRISNQAAQLAIAPKKMMVFADGLRSYPRAPTGPTFLNPWPRRNRRLGGESGPVRKHWYKAEQRAQHSRNRWCNPVRKWRGSKSDLRTASHATAPPLRIAG